MVRRVFINGLLQGLFQGLAWALLAGFFGLALVPLVLMILASLLPEITGPGSLSALFAPQHWQLGAYAQIFRQLPVATYALNSVLVSVVTTAGYTLFAAMAGYALARLPVRYKSLWFWLILLTLMIPPQVNIVPLFLLMAKAGLINSIWALIIPGLFGAFGVFLMRQWFSDFPVSLQESAALDGCSASQTFWKIALPTARPVLVSLALWIFMATWNAFLWPLVATHADAARTLPVGLAALKASFRDGMDWPVLLAAATITVLPVLMLAIIGQKAWLSATLAGGVKE
ncbi:MAG: carbohydrate ABC transporter permease [Vampirovibrionales bacterium]|nr:carbohydrate ABC transporter permease [Vampirovibrionales bacterium]